MLRCGNKAGRNVSLDLCPKITASNSGCTRVKSVTALKWHHSQVFFSVPRRISYLKRNQKCSLPYRFLFIIRKWHYLFWDADSVVQWTINECINGLLVVLLQRLGAENLIPRISFWPCALLSLLVVHPVTPPCWSFSENSRRWRWCSDGFEISEGCRRCSFSRNVHSLTCDSGLNKICSYFYWYTRNWAVSVKICGHI